jgi:hypothetical protein
LPSCFKVRRRVSRIEGENRSMRVTRKALKRRDLLKGLAALGLALGGGSNVLLPRAFGHVENPGGLDAVQHQAYDDLKVFTDWLAREGDRGYIGEVNWPNDERRGFGDEAQWNALGEKWYGWADAANLWTTMWCVDEWQRWGGFWLTTYVSVGDGETRPISKPMAQAPVYEAHLSTPSYWRGINVSGAERWEDGLYTNSNSGTYGVDYWYASQKTMDYLASRGTKIIRLPFRWERIQPTLGESLRSSELTRLRACVDQAANAGLKVILDLHNYAEYWVRGSGGPVALRLGSSRLPRSSFSNVWRRLSNNFKRNPTIIAYDLMNEPNVHGGIPSAGYPSPPEAWEAATQSAVNAIRNNGDNKLLMIPGYAHIDDWSEMHPNKWIDDPADNHMYTAHQYFDPYRGPGTGGGKYRYSYDDENAYLPQEGY